MSLHMRTITKRFRKKPKNPIKNKIAADAKNPHGGISPEGIASVVSCNLWPLCSLAKLTLVTDDRESVFIIM